MAQKIDLAFEQYKLMVSSAMKVTEWRQSTNNFYLAINTALITITTYLHALIFTSLTGIVISILWFTTILYFNRLNKAKFDMINKMEKSLPVKMFGEEWEIYQKNRIPTSTEIEKYIPIVFIVVYVLTLLY